MSDFIDKGFLTVRRDGEDEFSEKKSRFLGFVRSVKSLQSFDNFLSEIKSLYPDATHHVWAYRIFDNGQLRELYSDDGEPSQSSGPPILKTLVGWDLINVAVIVVRYYGGTKLGVGGLVRAYSYAAKLALEKSEVIRKVPADLWIVDIDYSLLGSIENFLENHRGKTNNRNFAETVELDIVLPAMFRAKFERLLNDLTRGKGKFKIRGVEYVVWSKN